jgi:hypothetical protein
LPHLGRVADGANYRRIHGARRDGIHQYTAAGALDRKNAGQLTCGFGAGMGFAADLWS